MWYTEEEICKAYKYAKDKEQQILILAQLNLCSKKDIVNILVKNDIEVHSIRKLYPNQRLDIDKALEYYELGETDKQIGSKLGISPNGIAWWRKKNNLPSNSRRRKKVKKTL